MKEKEINEQLNDETLDELSGVIVSDEDDPIESEDPIEEAVKEKAEQKPEKIVPQKKKRSKKKIILICVGAFVLLLGIAIGLFFLIGTLTAHHYKIVDGEYNPSAPTYAVSYTTDELALINKAMKPDADEATIKQAIATIYAKANYNKIHNTEQAITVLRGQGSAKALGADGSMVVRGFKVQAGNEFYYQKAAPIVECDPIALQNTLEDALNQQERVYCNRDTDDYRTTGTLKGEKAKLLLDDKKNPMTVTLPFVPVGVPSARSLKSFESLCNKAYYLEDPREITNFLITKDTVVLKELKKGESYIEYDEKNKCYICRFSLLIEGDGHDDCVAKARQYLRDSAKSDNLEYERFDVILEVWENGYFKKMHDDEIWSGNASAGAKTKSTTWYESITYYDYDEYLFNEKDAEEYKGEDWAYKIIAHYKNELDSVSAQ